jgi:hypothetical protein
VVQSGNVIVNNMTFVESGDAPAILVTGGSLTLQNDDIIQASTGSTAPAILVTGGTVNLGTATNPGDNTLSVNSYGNLISNTTGNAISAVGNTFEVGGTVETASSLSFTSLATSAASSVPGQAVTLTATVVPNLPGSPTPTGSVDFVDTRTGTDLGSVALSGGTAAVSTSGLAPGTHVIVASYRGDGNYLPSAGTLTQTVGTVFIVNTAADTSAVNPLLGAQDSNGNISLRSAIQAVNAASNTGAPPVIEFDIPTTDPGYTAPTSVGITIVSLSGNVATLTTSAQVPVAVGQTVIVVGLSNSLFNGNFQVNAETPTSFSYVLVHADVASTPDSGTASNPGQFTITPQTALPSIGKPVVIDGFTEPGSSPNTMPNQGIGAGDNAVRLITLDGTPQLGGTHDLGPYDTGEEANAAFAAVSGPEGLVIAAGNSTVTGLVIQNFGASYFAFFPGGRIGPAFLGNGIHLTSSGNTVVGNYLTNTGTGVFVDNVPSNTIGGTTPGARNVLAANHHGVLIQGSGATDNQVQGDYIGTDGQQQLNLAADDELAGVEILGASKNTIGGTAAGAGNVIDSDWNGIFLLGNDNVVQGNYIGTDATGTVSLTDGNSLQGIWLQGILANLGTSGNTIGGTTAAARNVISGYLQDVVFQNQGTTDNVLEGNYIGTDATGTKAFNYPGGPDFDPGSQYGVFSVDAIGNVVGGVTPGSGNLISGISGDGVSVGTGTLRVEGNSIYNNGGLGIDFSVSGTPLPPVLNDSLGHSGPNNYQDFPILNAATGSSTDTLITGTFSAGTLNSQPFEPNTTFIFDFYANPSPDPTGYGQGQTYLGFATVTTDANGYLASSPDGSAVINNPDTANATFTADLTVGNLSGQWISATATDQPVTIGASTNGTSEFSPDVPVLAPNETFAQFLPGALPQSPTSANSLTIVAGPGLSQDTVIGAVNQLTTAIANGTLPPLAYPVTVTLNLNGGTYDDTTVDPPHNMTLVINGASGTNTFVGQSPAFTVTGGNVIVQNVSFTTATNAPTILVTGGSLTLLNDNIIQASNVFTDPAIAVTGGTVNLGTAANPGNNTLSVSSSGDLVSNTTGNPISAAGDTFVVGGTVETAPLLSFSSLATSAGSAIPGQPVTFTATVATDTPGSVTPTGSVDFYDATTGTDLGKVSLGNGVASLSTSALALGTHVIRASYAGDSTYLPSVALLTETVTQSIYVLNATASAALSLSGNAGIAIPGILFVDSKSRTALTESGNAKITAASIQVVGGVSTSGNATLSPAATTGGTAVPDPLASLTGPSTTGLTNYGAVSISGNKTQTLNPGIYSSISASGNASLTLNPGVYLIEGGGFTVTGNASVSGAGVTIYNTSSNYPSSTGSYGGIALSGNGTFSLTAPTSGPYAGIVIFQAHANTRALSLGGNAASGLTGTVYAPSALLYVSGNASVHGALDVNELSLTGNAASSQATDSADVSGGDAAGQLLAGNMEVYVNNQSGLFTPDELARIQDAVNAADAVVEPYGVSVQETTDPSLANVVIDTGSTSAVGGYGDGILGCYTTSGEITLIQGWNWYAGSDPTQISANQYDFETTVTHEFGHALGLGESSDPTSAMYGTLAPGTVMRTLTTADLNIPYDEAGADAQRAAPAQPVPSGGVMVISTVPEVAQEAGPVQGALASVDLSPAERGNVAVGGDQRSPGMSNLGLVGSGTLPTAAAAAGLAGSCGTPRNGENACRRPGENEPATLLGEGEQASGSLSRDWLLEPLPAGKARGRSANSDARAVCPLPENECESRSARSTLRLEDTGASRDEVCSDAAAIPLTALDVALAEEWDWVGDGPFSARPVALALALIAVSVPGEIGRWGHDKTKKVALLPGDFLSR